MRQLQQVIGNGIPLQAIAADQLAAAKHIAAVGSFCREYVVSEVLLEVWAPEQCTLDLVLHAATPHPLTVEAPIELLVNDGKLVSKSPHGLHTGDGPFYTTTGTAQDAAPQWVQRLSDKAIRLGSSLDALLAGAPGEVPAAVAEKGTTALVSAYASPTPTPASAAPAHGPQRLCWAPVHALGEHRLSPQVGLSLILRHTPRARAYALVSNALPSGKGTTPSIAYGAIWPLRES